MQGVLGGVRCDGSDISRALTVSAPLPATAVHTARSISIDKGMSIERTVRTYHTQKLSRLVRIVS